MTLIQRGAIAILCSARDRLYNSADSCINGCATCEATSVIAKRIEQLKKQTEITP